MDAAELIGAKKFQGAFLDIRKRMSRGEKVFVAQILWADIFASGDFDPSKIEFSDKDLSHELAEAIRLYYLLRQSAFEIIFRMVDWDAAKQEKYKDAAKEIILAISGKVRGASEEGYIFHPETRDRVQDMIHWFEIDGAIVDMADLSAVKAQMSGSLFQLGYLDKHAFGSDMLQYAENYAKIDLKDQARRIYEVVVEDFEPEPESPVSILFPEIQRIPNSRFPELDHYVYEKAVFELNKLNGIESAEPFGQVLDERRHLHELAKREAAQKQEWSSMFSRPEGRSLEERILNELKELDENKNEKRDQAQNSKEELPQEAGGLFKRIRSFFK